MIQDGYAPKLALPYYCNVIFTTPQLGFVMYNSSLPADFVLAEDHPAAFVF